MPVDRYSWPLLDSFVERPAETAAIEAWWDEPARQPLAVIGRRRVGKSWLLRRFAHGRPALILVADQLPDHAQLDRFAEVLEGPLGVRPSIPDVPTLFRVLYRLGRDHEVLVVVDEFPWLLGTTSAQARQTLTAIQAVMEDERDSSQLRLVLCGSQVSQMEALFSEANPLHGRLRRLAVRPLAFDDAARFLPNLDPVEAFERFAVTGGMPMYLARLSRGDLRRAVCTSVLAPDAPLFNEGRAIVEQELREPRLYFAILEQLGGGAKPANEIGDRVGVPTSTVSKYLIELEALGLVTRHAPFGAPPTVRTGRWRLSDEFLRFWFRFLFPYQVDLEAGLRPESLYDNEIADQVADHVAPVFEEWCLHWLRRASFAGATRFGRWWGNAANELRRTGERTTEEIDAVGSARGRVVVVGEAKWTSRPVGAGIVDEIERFKLPALRQSGLKVAPRPRIVLFSRSGYTDRLQELAGDNAHITLVDVGAEIAG